MAERSGFYISASSPARPGYRLSELLPTYEAREKPGYPRFKSKHNHRQSYKSKCVGTNIKVLDHAVQLPKLGKVKCRISREVKGRILSATISAIPAASILLPCAVRMWK
ncbi:MAG: hypothetical protein ACLSAF_14775 [Intestinimonas sp.]